MIQPAFSAKNNAVKRKQKGINSLAAGCGVNKADKSKLCFGKT